MDKNASLESKHIYKCLYLPNGEYQGCLCWRTTVLWLVFFLGLVLPMTIRPMEAAMTSRYTAPVESSQTIRPAFRLETLEVIFPMVATSVEVFLSGCAGSNVSILTAVSTRLRVGVADCLTASTLVSGTTGREGVPSESLDDWLEVNREGLPRNIGILFCWWFPQQ